ncbi:unnamed protein product [Caenorhabditis bovis]|uniref:Major facilitator superfamily (MFS) profile domain-containing protein n=1 Tax=Caenorhabditis bovis TaxID=2654633 RepID=A0A8S1EB26_9PELO|nr:unnamed protein product [Caenorhabditis bovis]
MSASNILDQRQTDWKSMWISVFLQFLVGLQISAYFMSMWPYLSGLDRTADLDFLGWVVASCSIGCTIANPLFGYWNEKTMSVRNPAITGFMISAIGQFWYAILCVFPNVKWYMLGARFLTGFGVGNISVLRVYGATASTPKDRMKAISYGTGGLALGFSFGPVISAAFTPIGEVGLEIGSFRLNMYTVVALLMCAICIASSIVVYLFFEESYVGIVGKEEQETENIEVPKFDVIGALICIYLFMIATILGINLEVMSAPLTIAMYEWNDSQSIFYNGIALCLNCIITVGVNIAFGRSRLGKTDKRLQMLSGVTLFFICQALIYPWAFYTGPLNFLPANKTTIEIGGCLPEYDWCNYTTRVPLVLYMICFIVLFGIAFPLIETPSAALYSEVLGPRKQGMMQGFFSFGGSIAPVISSISTTYIFKHLGYRYVVMVQAAILVIGGLLILIFYKRLVPLKLISKNSQKMNSSTMGTHVLNERQTDWKSMWISIFLQFLVGVQISVYYMSMWPYLRGLDATADVDFLGWVVASCSIGCTIANPVYGHWNQKTMSVTWPAITGFIIAAIGQFWYALLSLFPNAKWYMMGARFLTGLGVGNLSMLRVYGAMASTPKDRMRAISYGTGGYVLGFSFGPVISAAFTPIGEAGLQLGGYQLNMYTVVALLMSLVCIIACFIVYFFFEESYAGIVEKEEKGNEMVTIPKFDTIGALTCIYLFMIVGIIATNIEVMSTPLTTVLYDWNDSQSIFYNGLALCMSCVVSVGLNIVLGSSRLGKINKRIQMLIGSAFFFLYQIFMYPWAFYTGPLNFLPANKTTIEIGGCLPEYD